MTISTCTTGYVALAGITEAIYLLSALADALGVSIQNVNNPQHKIETFLAERDMLLIFDNVEHLPNFALWLADLMVAAPDIKILVTSRRHLGLREEWVIPLEGLAFGLSPETPSVQLLAQTALQQGQVLRRDDYALFSFLEGLPLGIELAGASLRDSAATLLEKIQANMDSCNLPGSILTHDIRAYGPSS